MKDKSAILFVESGDGKTLIEYPGIQFGYRQSLEEIEKSIESNNAIERGFGEVVFNTAMTGYQEILTDPSYFGQLVCMTYPHIGNTGINDEDDESSRSWFSGLIVHDYCEFPSNWRSKKSLKDYLIENKIPGIEEVDTRGLTIHLRSKGAVRGLILNKEDKDHAVRLFEKMPKFEGRDLIARVTPKEPMKDSSKSGSSPYRVVALDYGMKTNLFRILKNKGCEVIRLPAGSSSEEILSHDPEGIFLSNGPGDPAAAAAAAKTVENFIGKIPVFGVCMGHQLLSMAVGGKTFKLKFGHHGANQPVLDRETGQVHITSQNHGFAVEKESLPDEALVTHVHLNDQTVAGMMLPNRYAYSVQFHPEAAPGPHDSEEVFDQFLNWMKEKRS